LLKQGKARENKSKCMISKNSSFKFHTIPFEAIARQIKQLHEN
jgi:hypothetical protein